MKFLVGYSDNGSGKDALKLGINLAQMLQGELVVCRILPKQVKHSASTIDEDYFGFLKTEAQKSLDKAKLEIPTDLEAQYVIRSASTVADGLRQTASDLSADCLVMGSGKMAINSEFITGSIVKDLLKHIDMPLALAPKGFYNNHSFGDTLTQISCAVSGSKKSYTLATQAAEWAAMFDVPLRIVIFGVRDTDITPTAAGLDAENIVINAWREQIEADYQKAIKDWDSDVPISLDIGDGDNWKKSIRSVNWSPNELLIVGYNRGEILKHFLSKKNVDKILRYAYVPRLVLPRSHK